MIPHVKTRTQELVKRGYHSYRDYLASEHWSSVRRAYRSSGRPIRCFICDDPRYQLHHRSYARIGREYDQDLVPLCSCCHQKIHDRMKSSDTRLAHFNALVQQCFGWSKLRARRRFEEFGLEFQKFSQVGRPILDPNP